LFNPIGFLEVAREMVALNPAEERQFRTAIGRCLYAVFLHARESLEEAGEPVKEVSPERFSQEHHNVRQAFNPAGRPRPRFAHLPLRARIVALYQARWRADYNLTATVTEGEARQAIADAEYCLSEFSHLGL
jgi:uncharacterized protein (UPF0332 family)